MQLRCCRPARDRLSWPSQFRCGARWPRATPSRGQEAGGCPRFGQAALQPSRLRRWLVATATGSGEPNVHRTDVRTDGRAVSGAGQQRLQPRRRRRPGVSYLKGAQTASGKSRCCCPTAGSGSEPPAAHAGHQPGGGRPRRRRQPPRPGGGRPSRGRSALGIASVTVGGAPLVRLMPPRAPQARQTAYLARIPALVR